MEGQESASDGVGLLVLEAKSLRPFKTKDEYLYAMKEDLAEWFKCLYTEILIDADNFLDVLETGVVLCQHANEVRKFTVEQKAKGVFEVKSNFVRDIQIPQYDVQFRVDVKPGTFLSRDNISNFITWTAKMGIPEVLRFETDDLVMRKNERSVVLCLLEVARVGAKFGMLAPTIVQMEEEIDAEIETGQPPPQIKTCDIKSLDEMVRELVGRCTCPVQFPIIKVGEGKYKIGDNQTLVFVRILRKHVMIRVGGGWDTLEHYLDRLDPCRCRFEGHQRGPGRGPTTPRRSSSSNVSNSVPNTPKSPRKLSMTTPVHSAHSGSARPASPGMRSQSPGPNSKRKLSLSVKGESNSQPASCVTSPNVSGKAPSFSNTWSSRDKVIQEGENGSGNTSFGSFVKQSQNSISRQISSGYGGTLPRQVTPRRSASPALRAQSPSSRRSESPALVPTDRLRSPSPVHSKKKVASTTYESRNGRCESPIKQITLSEVRSSREGKPTPSHTVGTPRSIRRQTSTTSSNGDSGEMTSDGTKPNLTIDKISTMSLGEFKSLLNSALSVPNGAGGSDSPRSQTSVDTNSRKGSLTSSAGHKPSPYKSAPGSRSTSANRAGTVGSSYYPSKLGSVKPKERSNLDSSSSGYSTASSSVDKSVRSTVSATNTRARTPSGRVSSSVSKSVSNTSIRSESSGGGHDNKRPRTPNSIYKSNSNSSNVSETSNTLQPAFRINNASRCSSHSSLKSYESTDSHSFDERASQQSEPAERGDRIPLTPGSATSDYSYRNSYTSNPESPGQIRSDTDCGHSLASKCVCREQNGIILTTKEQPVVEENPRNVGYSYMFSYSDKQVKEPENSANNKYDLNALEQELADLTAKADDEMDLIHGASSDDQQNSKPVRSHTPNGRSHTPSFLPVPITPKSSRKPLSTPVTDSSDKSTGRPPTPRKSNIIARAPTSTVRSADRGREQTYRDIFHKRSMTPGPEGRAPTTSQVNTRRSSTPGPYLHKSSLSSTSATTTRARLNESLTQKGTSGQLSVFNGDTPTTTGRSRRELVGNAHQRTQSMERKALTKQYSNENQEAETVIIVNRSNGHHSLNVQGEEATNTRQTPNKSKVLARARVDDTRSRNEARKPISRQRPQSVEPRQLVPRKQLTVHDGTTDNAAGEDDHLVYNRTQEWVQTAVANTKVKKTKTTKVLPRSRRAMTPNSFDMHRDMDDTEEPRTLDEIKAALSLPINGISSIDPDTIEAPPENPDMYNQMEKLFNELRQQELKSSVNETPGVASNDIKPKSKSKSNSSANDEDSSLDSNRNIRKKPLSVSTKSSSNATSPAVSRSDKSPVISLRSHSSHGVPKRPSSPSPKLPGSSASVSNKDGALSSGSSGQRPLSARTQTVPISPRVTSNRPSSPAFKVQPQSQRSSTSSMSFNTGRPVSPAPKVQTQRSTPSTPSTNRPASPAFKGRPRSPSSSPHTQRPASPSFKSQSSRSSVSSSSSQPPRPSSPVAKVKSTPSTPRRQPARPASTPPRPSTPVSRQSSKASDDSVFETSDKKVDSIVGAGLLSKLKEIIKVKPRKDKQDKVKTRIPAPKSLASHRKSQSFSNLSTLSDTMSLAHTCPDLGNYVSDSQHIDPHVQENGWCGDETLNGVASKADPPQPRLMTPLNTGRSTLIRKESMDKNKEFRKLARAVSVERNMNTMNVHPYLDEGEYV